MWRSLRPAARCSTAWTWAHRTPGGMNSVGTPATTPAPPTGCSFASRRPMGRARWVIEGVGWGAPAAGRHESSGAASHSAGATDGLQFRVTAANGAGALDATALSLSKISAVGAENGQLVLTLAN